MLHYIKYGAIIKMQLKWKTMLNMKGGRKMIKMFTKSKLTKKEYVVFNNGLRVGVRIKL